MSNNVAITDGSGSSSIAAEQIGNTKYQIIKLVGAETGSTSVLGVNPDRSINVSVIGIPNVNFTSSIVTVITGNASISGTVGASIIGQLPGGNAVLGAVAASISGTVNVSGSVIGFQGGTRITSIVSSIPSSVLVGASIFGQLPAGTAPIGSVATLQGTNPWITLNTGSVISVGQGSIATVIIGGSIAATFTPPVNQSVSGAVSVSNFPTTQNVSGSVVGFQGTTPWVTTAVGSVITIWQSPSIVGTYAEDAGSTTADKGIFVLGVRNDTVASLVSADLDYAAMASDSAGRSLIKPYAAEESRVEGYASLVSSSVTTLVAAAGTGLRNYITDIMIANSGATATAITFKDGAGSILGYTIAPAGGGSNIIGMMMPMRTGANATFDFQPTSASSILFATVKGFKAP